MNGSQAIERPRGPWYREPWPWILMSGPFAAVVAGLATAWIAVTHQDGLVVEDYYKQGLAINRTIDKERAAGRLGITAQVQFSADGRHLRVYVRGHDETARKLGLTLAHATVTGVDRHVDLVRGSGGWYEGKIDPLQPGKWQVLLEDPSGAWRVTGLMFAGAGDSVTLAGLAR